MRSISLFAGGSIMLMVGCGIVGTYDYDDYEDKPVGAGGDASVSSSSSSSSSAGGGGSGGGAGGGTPPPVELCNNGLDEDGAGDGDCSVIAEWSARFGDGVVQKLRSAHSDNTGDVAISGEYQGTLDFNGKSVSQSTNKFQPYAARLKSDGSAIFAHKIDRNGAAKGVVLRDKALVMVGEYEKINDSTKKNIFIRKVDSNGSFGQPEGWHVEFGEHDLNRGVDIATTIAANAPVLVVAMASGVATTPIAGDSTKCLGFTGNDGSRADAVILALNSQDGYCTWSVQIANATPTSIVANTATVTVAGTYKGKINPTIWTDAKVPNGAGIGSFIAAYDAFSGKEKWHQTFIAQDSDQIISFSEAALDALGNVAVTGTLTGKWNIAGHAYNSSENATSLDVIVANFDGATGNVLWADRFGGTGPQLANSIAQLNGRILVGGKTTSAMAIENDADTGPLCVDANCMFLLSIDEATGAPAWGRSFGGTEPFNGDTRVKLATGMSNLWLASGWSTAVDFGQGSLVPLTPGSDEDVFLAKFTSLP